MLFTSMKHIYCHVFAWHVDRDTEDGLGYSMCDVCCTVLPK